MVFLSQQTLCIRIVFVEYRTVKEKQQQMITIDFGVWTFRFDEVFGTQNRHARRRLHVVYTV